jgi:hypothetical protein
VRLAILMWLFTRRVSKETGVPWPSVLEAHTKLVRGMATVKRDHDALLRTAAEIEALDEVQR